MTERKQRRRLLPGIVPAPVLQVRDQQFCNPEEIGAYVKGDYIGIEKVNDPTFAQKILGEGVAVIPSDNKICAPADVSVEMVADTKHVEVVTCLQRVNS